MNFKTTYVLFGLLVVIFGVFAVVLFYDPGSKDTGNYLLPQFHADKEAVKADEIDRVEIVRNEPKQPTLVLERDPSSKQWKITEPIQARADAAAVENLVRQLADATRTKADKAPSLGAWGLEPPQAVVTLKIGTDQTFKLNIGKEGGVGDAAVVYVQDPNRPKDPMAVRKQALDAVFRQLPDYRDPVLLAAVAEDVRGVKISDGKSEVALEKQEGHWRYTVPADYGEAEVAGTIAPSDSSRAPTSVNVLLTNLTNLKLEKASTDIIADNVADADLAKYNLDSKSDVLHVAVMLAVGDKPVELLVGVGKKVDDKYYYAKLANEKTVVRLKATDADALRALLGDRGALRNRTLVASERAVDAIDVKNSGGTVRLRREEGAKPPPTMPGRQPRFDTDAWMLWRDDTTPSTVDPQLMMSQDSLLNLLKQKNLIVSFIDLQPKQTEADLEKELELTNPAAVVSLWAGEDGVGKDDAKDEKTNDKAKDEKPKTLPKLKSAEPTYRISFGKHIGEGGRELVVVKRETKRKAGDKSAYDVAFAKIPMLVFDKAKKGPLTYMDRQLPPYTTEGSPAQNMTRLQVQRAGAINELTRAKDADPWTIVKPEGQANRLGDPQKVFGVVGMMNGLIASELIADKADKNDLEKTYGLEPPQTRVDITVTKDGKPTTYSVLFGKDGPKDGPKETVFAKQSWRDTIFTIDKGILVDLPTDFQDTTVAKFDPANVATLKLTGWQDLVGTPVAIDLERKDATTWTVKTPANYNVDPAKVKALLDTLSKLKAEKFVAKLPKPDAGLEMDKGALKIELTFAKDDKPLELVVGKLEGDTYLATSSLVPGEVFAVKKSVFEGPKSKPAYFNP